jgi:hypothetical protein
LLHTRYRYVCKNGIYHSINPVLAYKS